jgi:hypothetical protein
LVTRCECIAEDEVNLGLPLDIPTGLSTSIQGDAGKPSTSFSLLDKTNLFVAM